MAAIVETLTPFDRHSSVYKGMKRVRNTRTSTLSTKQQPAHPKSYLNELEWVLRLKALQSSSQHPNAEQFVSYKDWKHDLDYPNSPRKFEVVYTGVDDTTPCRMHDTLISGNINMLPLQPQRRKATVTIKRFSNLKREYSMQQKLPSKKAKTDNELLNMTIVEEHRDENFIEYPERLQRRNERLVKMVVPFIKKNLKRIFVGDSEGQSNIKQVKTKSTKLFNNIAGHYRYKNFDRLAEDREALISKYDDIV